MGRKRAPSGTWFPRKMAYSKAYWALNKTAKGLIVLFLMKRDMSRNHEVKNKDNITLTFLELEHLFGESGLSRSSINRGIADLMAKGFIKVVRSGGAYQSDKTVYGLCHDWELWEPGRTVREKTKGKKVGYLGNKNNLNVQNGTHTHRHSGTLKPSLGCRSETQSKNAEHTDSAT